MRLFIAVNFDDDIKDRIMNTSLRLRKEAVRGSFSARENLHITVVFIGEVRQDRVDTIKEIVDSVSVSPFDVEISGLGAFKRNEGDIYWLGIRNYEPLGSISGYLSRRLRKAGFDIEDRPFKPHLTLGRRVIMAKDFDREKFSRETDKVSCPVSRISLMLSERKDGKLIYTEIYGKELE